MLRARKKQTSFHLAAHEDTFLVKGAEKTNKAGLHGIFLSQEQGGWTGRVWLRKFFFEIVSKYFFLEKIRILITISSGQRRD